ncbi:helix-turn-helix domain-containing protein [Hamadaea sp. NPDC051192]|uniref:TetR/AcrR family transcriptional regulator n=1 Tax=Hamadaea sp. NPDC051192 TaxID=3154940 RepID=UPI00343E71AF
METLRERKRARTRQAIIDAATELFSERGYDGTTIADISAAADIGTRTFFSYFASKEELLFPEADLRVAAAIAAIDNRQPGERPVEVLVRTLHEVNTGNTEMVGTMAQLRLQLMHSTPAVRGRALQVQLDSLMEIAGHLHQAYADELNPVEAAATVGAFIGAVSAALQMLLDEPGALDDPAKMQRRMWAAVEKALLWTAKTPTAEA